MEQAAVQIGAVLAGRYRVDRVLGQGGMGVVVQAMHLQLHQPVAIKFLLPEVLINQQIVQRFVREAQAAVRLRSEHVARVIDVGTLETGAPYMVLEYLDGCDLSNFPRAQLTVGIIVDVLLQACEALAEAHSLGIVHRDIKPANFFITRRADGSPLLKVLDFGISKMPVADSNLTATQTVMGTPAYMSPEQMKSTRDVDPRSDIWSLGIVLYELLQGAPPFGGETFSSMILRVVTEPLPRLTVALPPGLDAIIYRCLEKEPAQRFQTVAELAHALARYASSTTQAAISVQRTLGITGLQSGFAAPSVATTAASSVAPSVAPSVAGTGRGGAAPGGKRRWPLFVGAGALAGALALVAAVVGGGGDASSSAPSSAAAPSAASAAPSASSAAPSASPASAAVAVPSPSSSAPPSSPAPPEPAPAPPLAAQAVASSPSSSSSSSPSSSSSSPSERASRRPRAASARKVEQGKPAGGGAEGDILGSRN